MTPIQIRQAAAQATVARFDGRPLAWGRDDCARMAAFHIKRLGHKVSLAKAGSYHSAAGAVRAIRRAGHASLAAAVDAHGLPRIAPARAMMGDLIGLRADGAPEADGPEAGGEGWVALMVCLGNGRALGFLEGRCGVIQPLEIAIAWRASPCRKRP